MLDFKVFLDAAQNGQRRNDLYLVPTREWQRVVLTQLLRDAAERALNPVVSSQDSKVTIGLAQMRIRVAYEGVSEPLRDLDFTAMYNDELLAPHDLAILKPRVGRDLP